MTPEAQRIAIAEAYGWKWVNTGPLYSPWVRPIDKEQFGNPPDYLNDLNAMHEAEKVALKTVGWMAYGDALYKVTDNNGFPGPLFHATAAQRAEAFLKAIGKWVD